VQLICGLLARRASERAAYLRAGIGLTAWNTAKRSKAELRERIASARDDWARLRQDIARLNNTIANQATSITGQASEISALKVQLEMMQDKTVVIDVSTTSYQCCSDRPFHGSSRRLL